MGYKDARAGMRNTLQPWLTSGDEFFVSSVLGGSGNSGRAWGAAKATIAQALALCSAGDVVYVAEDHVEDIIAAGTITVSVAGVTVIGLGRGSRKPTLTWGTATTATLLVSGANVLLRNFRCVGDINDLVKFIDVNADFCTIEDFDFVTSSAKEAFSFINIRTTKDNLTIRRCTALQPTDPAGTDGGADTGFLYCVDSENILVEDCSLFGNFETAMFHNRTTKVQNFWVRNTHGHQALSGAEPFQLVAASSGGAYNGHINVPAEAAVTEATLVGTIGDVFFISPTFTFGNDGLAGGQGGIVVATAS